jgi:hypothetical protein
MENTRKDTKRAGERARDEQREGGPRYGGGAWEVADERGDRRFGHARNDEATLSEVEPTENARPEEEDQGSIESGGQRVGIGHPEKPRRTQGMPRPPGPR